MCSSENLKAYDFVKSSIGVDNIGGLSLWWHHKELLEVISLLN